MNTNERGTSVLAAATVATGLVAGVYYAFACSVMLGLGASGDRTFIEAMQNTCAPGSRTSGTCGTSRARC